jgi:hypothetical protein
MSGDMQLRGQHGEVSHICGSSIGGKVGLRETPPMEHFTRNESRCEMAIENGEILNCVIYPAAKNDLRLEKNARI